eukprot:g403.t1
MNREATEGQNSKRAQDKSAAFIQMATDAVAGRRDDEARDLLRELCSGAGLEPESARYPVSEGGAGDDDVAPACLVPRDVALDGVFDSKGLGEAERAALYRTLVTHPRVEYGVCAVNHTTIDQINILQATYRAMEGAVEQLVRRGESQPGSQYGGATDAVLVDGNRVPPRMAAMAGAGAEVEAVVKGDAKVFSIAAASIIAKETRDRIMAAAHERWPQYDFAQHKGYPTKTHQALVHKHGPCPIHRMTFAPLKRWWPAEDEDEDD